MSFLGFQDSAQSRRSPPKGRFSFTPSPRQKFLSTDGLFQTERHNLSPRTEGALNDIEELPDDWNSYGAKSFSSAVIAIAKEIISCFEEREQPEIYPTSKGEIVLVKRMGSQIVKFFCSENFSPGTGTLVIESSTSPSFERSSDPILAENFIALTSSRETTDAS